MGLVERIQENDLPIKQLRAIESILDDLESNSFLSGSELCKKYNISFSSLTRLAKSLKYDGFPELKKEIEKMYKGEFSPSHQAQNFIENSRDESILNLVLKSEIRNLNKLSTCLNELDLLEAAKKVNNSSKVFVIGIGQMAIVANKFSESLKLLSKNVICFTELGFSKQIQMHMPSDEDIVITFSINKELIEFEQLLRELNRGNIDSILFSDKKTGRLRKYANNTFYAPSNGNGMINCITPFIVLTNIFESILFSLDKQVHLAKIKNIENNWSSLPIFLN